MLLVNIFIDYMFYPYNGRPINVNCSLLIAKYPQTPHQIALLSAIHRTNKKRREPQINSACSRLLYETVIRYRIKVKSLLVRVIVFTVL